MEQVYKRTLGQLTQELKQEFFGWCGSLSMEEIMANPNLIVQVEKLERAIFAAIEIANTTTEGKGL